MSSLFARKIVFSVRMPAAMPHLLEKLFSYMAIVSQTSPNAFKKEKVSCLDPPVPRYVLFNFESKTLRLQIHRFRLSSDGLVTCI